MKVRKIFLSFLFVSFLSTLTFDSLKTQPVSAQPEEKTGLAKLGAATLAKIKEIGSLFADVAKQIGPQIKKQVIDPLLPKNLPGTIKKTLEGFDYDKAEEVFLGIKNFKIEITIKEKKLPFGPVDLGIALAMQRPEPDESYTQGEWYIREVTLGTLYKFFTGGKDVPSAFKDLGKLGLLSVILGKVGEYPDPMKSVIVTVRDVFLRAIDPTGILRKGLAEINRFLRPKGDEVFLIMFAVLANSYIGVPTIETRLKDIRIVDFVVEAAQMAEALKNTILFDETKEKVKAKYPEVNVSDAKALKAALQKDPRLLVRFRNIGPEVWVKRLPGFIKAAFKEIMIPIPLNVEDLQEWQDRKNLSPGDDLDLIRAIRNIREYKGYDIKVVEAEKNILPMIKEGISFTEAKRLVYFFERLIYELKDSKRKAKTAPILEKLIEDASTKLKEILKPAEWEFITTAHYTAFTEKLNALLKKLREEIEELKKAKEEKEEEEITKKYTAGLPVLDYLRKDTSVLPLFHDEGKDILSFGWWFDTYQSDEPQTFDLKYLYDDSILPLRLAIIKLGYLLKRELILDLAKVVKALKTVKDITVTDEKGESKKIGKSTYAELITNPKKEYTDAKKAYDAAKRAYEEKKDIEKPGTVAELKKKMEAAKKDSGDKKKNYLKKKLEFFKRVFFVKALFDNYERADKLKDWIIEAGGKVPEVYETLEDLKKAYKEVEKDATKYAEREKELKTYKRKIFDSIIKGFVVLFFVRTQQGEKVVEPIIKVAEKFGINLRSMIDDLLKTPEKADEIVADIRDRKEPEEAELSKAINDIMEDLDLGEEEGLEIEEEVEEEKPPVVEEEKVPEEKVSEEKVPEEKVPEEKVPEEKVPEEKVPEEKVPEEKPPVEELLVEEEEVVPPELTPAEKAKKAREERQKKLEEARKKRLEARKKSAPTRRGRIGRAPSRMPSTRRGRVPRR